MRLSFAPSFASSVVIHLFAADEAGRVGLAERDVAGSVLIEQRVPVEDAALRDWGVMRHECDFAQAAGAIVCRDEAVQHVFTGGGRGLNDLPAFKADSDVFNQRALVGEWLGGSHHAVDAVLVRRREAFLGGNVGLAVDTVSRGGSAAGPEMMVGKADPEVSVPSAT